MLVFLGYNEPDIANPQEKECEMTVARELAQFLTGTSVTDLPPQAVEHAAMLIASTVASAAMGTGLESSAIIRSLARERGGAPQASLWFDPGPKLPLAEAVREFKSAPHSKTPLIAAHSASLRAFTPVHSPRRRA